MRPSSLLLSVVLFASCVSCAHVESQTEHVQAIARRTLVVEASGVFVTVDPEKGPTLVNTGTTATGFTVAARAGRTLVVTNWHICDVASDAPSKDDMLVGASFSLTNSAGRSLPGRVVYYDGSADTCFLSLDGSLSEVVPIAAADPEVGSPVERVGNDDGLSTYHSGIALYFAGTFSGVRLMRDEAHPLRQRAVLSMPASAGASGSPILSRGSACGMLSSVPFDGVSHVAFAVTSHDLRIGLAQAEARWK